MKYSNLPSQLLHPGFQPSIKWEVYDIEFPVVSSDGFSHHASIKFLARGVSPGILAAVGISDLSSAHNAAEREHEPVPAHSRKSRPQSPELWRLEGKQSGKLCK